MDANKIREIRIIRENPRFRHYPEYKESGVEWIGKIPAHWKIKKIKHVVTFVSEKSTPETDDIKISPENVESKTGKVLDFYSSYDSIGVKFQVGDVLFNKIRVYLNKVVFAEYGGYSLGEMIVIRPSLEDIGKYLFYLMLSSRFIEYCNSISKGAKMPRTDVYDILNAQIPITSYQEQTQIANFLDRKTKQIDELIRIKERRIELLQAQRTTLVNQAVTKGLDPNVEMKPSGVEWIGEIPVHWKISKVKHEFESLDNLRVPLNSETRGSMELKVYDYYGASGIIDKVENYIFDEPLILIGEDGANLQLRSTPLAFKATGKYWVNNHAHVLRPKHGIIDYLTNMLESLDYTHYITGAAQPKLTSEHLMNITVIIPPSLEQDQIANYLNHKTKQIDELIATEHRKIELLKEYRQSLISEAVTGKIDVRNEV